jgi:hypothetical protein
MIAPVANQSQNSTADHFVDPKATHPTSYQNQFTSQETFESHPRTNNERSSTVFYDLEHDPYSESMLKLNKSTVEASIENNVVSRQFPDKETRDLMLGTATPMFTFENFLRQVVGRPNLAIVINVRLRQVFSSADMFKQVCLWKWALAGQAGLSLDTFAKNGSIVERSDLCYAIDQFNLFLTTTFGSCWATCTAKFVQALSVTPDLVVLNTKYLQSQFESVCCEMHNEFRTSNSGSERLFGDSFSFNFSQKLDALELSWTSQLVWEFTVRDATSMHVTKKNATTMGLSVLAKESENAGQQICFNFLRKELSLRSTDGHAHGGCKNQDCTRRHQGVFSLSKAQVLQQLSNSPISQHDLATAVNMSDKFAS